MLPVRVERLLLRTDPDADAGGYCTNPDRQLHELRGLGMGKDRCGGHGHHRPGAAVFSATSSLLGCGDDSGCGQAVIHIEMSSSCQGTGASSFNHVGMMAASSIILVA